METSRKKEKLIVQTPLVICTLCSKRSISNSKSVELTETIENWFFDLTQMDVTKLSQPQKVCLECFRDLRFCIEFRTLLIDNLKDIKNLQSLYEKEVFGGSDHNLKIGEKFEIADSSNILNEESSVKIECIDVTCESLVENNEADQAKSDAGQEESL
jgi:hypothetical protein